MSKKVAIITYDMKIKIQLLSLLLLCCNLAICNTQPNARSERKITRTFSVGNNALLKVDSRYGDIKVMNWDKNEIMIDVHIKAEAEREENAKALADRVDIKLLQTGNTVSAVTALRKMKEFDGDSRLSIYYTICMPSTVTMDFKQQYGKIRIGDTPNPFTCDLQYGDLVADALSAASNQIICAYSNVKINTVNTLSLKTSYSKVSINTARKLHTESQYDNYLLGTISQLDVQSGDYGNFTISQLTSTLNIPGIRYGSIQVSATSPELKNILIKAQYTGLRVKLNNEDTFTANLSTSFGHIKVGNTFNTFRLKNQEDEFSCMATGIIGPGNSPRSTVTISNSYGDINIGE